MCSYKYENQYELDLCKQGTENYAASYLRF